VIIVLGSALDPAAAQLVTDLGQWRPAGGARLVSAEDLGRPGWAFDPAAPSEGRLVAGGAVLPVAEVHAVVVRRPAVAAEELAWLDPADRQYGAAESNAFLVAWLSALPVPVLNRPSATCLCGPGWSRLHWRLAAERIGVPWRQAPTSDEAYAGRDVLVCGGSVHGARDPGEAGAVIAISSYSGASGKHCAPSPPSRRCRPTTLWSWSSGTSTSRRGRRDDPAVGSARRRADGRDPGAAGGSRCPDGLPRPATLLALYRHPVQVGAPAVG
jgi:hypothetical protein